VGSHSLGSVTRGGATKPPSAPVRGNCPSDSLIAATEFAPAKLRFAPGNLQRRALVLIEPLEQAVQARSKLS
jgi:hypothetical protein